MKNLLSTLCVIIMISTVTFAQTGKEDDKRNEIKTEQGAVGSSQLPAAVQSCVDKEFPGYVVVTFRKYETAQMDEKPYYDVQVEKGKVAYTARISEDGKLLKKTAIKAEARESKKAQ